jgi:ABC-type glycerol-3-phosphate transport system permease component
MKKYAHYLALTLVAVILMTPLYWMITTAVKSHEQTFTIPPQWVPNPIQWDNFSKVFQEVPFGRFVINTLIIVFWNVIGQVFSTTLIAYGFARLRFPFRDKLFLLLLSTLMIPYQITLVPRFILFSKMGWINTYLPLIVPAFTGNPFLIFMVRQYMMSIPMDLDEAATIDGANRWQILWKVIMPLCTPVLALVVVFTFTGVWNDFMSPLIYLNDPDKFTVTLGLNFFRGAKETCWELLMAASLMSTLPPLLVFFFAQRKLVGGIASTGLKG